MNPNGLDETLSLLCVGAVQGKRQVPKQVLKRRRNYFKSVKKMLADRLRENGQLGCAVPDCECKDLEIHHILPLAMGGTNDIENLMFLCKSHHQQIHGKKEE